MKHRILASLLLLCLLLSLCACGKGDEEATVIISGTEGEMTDGWIPSRIPFSVSSSRIRSNHSS